MQLRLCVHEGALQLLRTLFLQALSNSLSTS